MAKQTFTAGQVLSATQVNNLQANDYNQTVSTKTDNYTLVAADAGTRVVMNSATDKTITVNTSLFAAGDTLWIHNIGAGKCTVTAGTATVSCSGSLALLQNQGGTLYFTSASAAIFFPSQQPGLTLLNTTSFSGVSSQSLPANTFTSSYAHYKLLCSFDSLGAGGNWLFRLRAAGVDNSSNNYIYAGHELLSTATTYSAVNSAATSSARIQYFDGSQAAASIELFNPQASLFTQWTSWGMRYSGTTFITERQSGTMTVSTSYDSLTLIFPNNVTGSISVYGFNK